MRHFVIAVLLFVLVAPAVPQTREDITVEVINVPVYVYTGTTAVTGLTRDDFELRVNGKPQPIDYFDVMDLAQPVVRPNAPASIAEQRRLFLLLFDMTFTSPERLLRGQRAAAAMVAHKSPADAYAVVAFTPSRGMDLLLQFTSDSEAIIGTVTTLRPRTAEVAARESAMEHHEPAIVATIDIPTQGDGSARGNRAEGEIAEGTPVSRELAKEPVRRLAERGLEGLAEIASALKKIDGFNKHVILISEEFRGGGSSSYMNELVTTMQRTFQDANAFLHGLDPAGVRYTYNQKNRSFTVASGDALRELSSGTGGQWLHNTNDLAGALINVSDIHRRAYVLGFTPRAPRRGHNTIEVRVKKLPKHARIAYRRGFSSAR